MKRKLSILSAFLILFCISFEVSAAITIQSVSGASYVETDASGNITVYGGIAGTCSPNGSTTCNSCANTVAPAQACNLQNVYGALPITINFTSDKALSGVDAKITTDASAGSTEVSEFSNYTVTASANTTTSVSLNWGYLCKNDDNFGSDACTTTVTPEANFINTARKIYLYVDENNDNDFTDDGEKKSVDVKLQVIDHLSTTINAQMFCPVADATKYGVCGYELGVGDSKFYLKRLFSSATSTGSSPAKVSSASPDWYGVAFMAADVADVNLISNGAMTPQIRKYNSAYELDDNTVTGLQNYKNYCLLMGNVSKAQNIYKFSNDTASPVVTCAQPSEVIGMLTDKSCFISTAAYGSDMADQVQLLRQFRNEFLLTNSFGKSLVKLYYQFSPPIAHFIENSEIFKAMTRGLLYPFVGMAWLAVHFGIIPILILLLGAVALIFRKRIIAHA